MREVESAGPLPDEGAVRPSGGDAAGAHRALVRVAEIAEERRPHDPPEIPHHQAGDPGTVGLQLRTTLRRVAMSGGLARREDLVSAVRALPGLPGLTTSPVGGTFMVGGPGWLGLCAVGVPPRGRGMPLDWMSAALGAWFRLALGGFGLAPTTGRVEGGWCPGFSDIAVGGRKLVGLGYRVTRDWVVMRGAMPVRPIADADMTLLVACHRLIGVEVVPGANVSLAEAAGEADLTVAEVLEGWRHVSTG
jgi:hypothetical protein